MPGAGKSRQCIGILMKLPGMLFRLRLPKTSPRASNLASKVPVRPTPEGAGPAIRDASPNALCVQQCRSLSMRRATTMPTIPLAGFRQYRATAQGIAGRSVAAGVSMMMRCSHALVAGAGCRSVRNPWMPKTLADADRPSLFGNRRAQARRRSTSGFLRAARNSFTRRPGAGPRTGLKPSSSSPERSSVARLPTAS